MPRAFFLFLCLLITSQFSWAAEGRADYDLDDDGLIEIDDWADLDEVRNNLDGSALYASNAGCPVDGCIGFELTTDLDFDTNNDGVLDSNDAYWNNGEGWQPIGSDKINLFTGVFYGNGHIIRNLMIARPNSSYQGLFGYLGHATIKELGLTGSLVKGKDDVGALAGSAISSKITAAFVSGSTMGSGDNVGGLIGDAGSSEITASYVTGAVSGHYYVGGVVGRGSNGGVIASLSTAYVVSDRYSSGLIGRWGSANTSYWAGDITSLNDSYFYGIAVTLEELQCPTDADNTSCTDTVLYEGWSNYKDSDGNAYWDFGGDTELPGLRLGGRVYRDGDGDGAQGDDDIYPTNFAGSVDSDGDGAIDRWTAGCDADCRAESGLILDQFPNTTAAIFDTDLDGLADQWEEGCGSGCQSGSGLTLDNLPNDTDNDGITNDIDDDDNNDGVIDVDANSNGLIDIASWEELNAIRYRLDSAGQKITTEAELDTSGCPPIVVDGLLEKRCQGYELIVDLDFDTNGDGVLDSSDTYWNDGKGWQPIGSGYVSPFTGVFYGNGHVIRNLTIARPDTDNQGLFGYLSYATIKEVGLSGPLTSITGRHSVGGIAGYARNSQVTATYVSGSIAGTGSGVGGLLGSAYYSQLTACYATGTVSGSDYIGGILGNGDPKTRVIASVSSAYVSGSSSVGGLVGIWGKATTSYWAKDASGTDYSYGGGSGVTLSELRCPTGTDNTDCADTILYQDWSNYADAEGNAYWDFGSSVELPGLRLQGIVYRDGDGDGVADADDIFPAEFAAAFDSDGDGAIDRWTPGCDADCRAASGLVLDQFPDSPAAIVDADWDGLPDQWNDGCDSACQSGAGLTLDSSLNDTDNDGIANDIDDDDNNDGIVDADANSNGLIEVATWAELDAMRYSLDGAGRQLTAEGELDTSGCPQTIHEGISQSRCQGYELTADLDFDTNGDGVIDSSDTYWNDGEGWQPIGRDNNNSFTGMFYGNGHLIRNLMIARPDSGYQGLFGRLEHATVKELGLAGPLMTIEGNNWVGGLAGHADKSQISAVYVSGSVAGTRYEVGGLLGSAYLTEVTASYTTGSVSGDRTVGGLVGSATDSLVTGSLSTAYISASSGAGGLTGRGLAPFITTSYWAKDASGTALRSGGGTGVTLAELQCATSADDTTCTTETLYEGWSSYKDTQGNAYWDFGSDAELPGLLLQGVVYRDGDGDGLRAEDDAFPAQFAASVDSDGDGAPDSWKVGCDADCRYASGLVLDRFPANAAASIDTDLDGLPDQWNDDCDSACQSASGLTLDDDNDNDGVANAQDAFPVDTAAAVDADNDGMPDAWLDTCDSVCQSASGLTLDISLNDTDNDGVTNDIDDLPTNAAASVDTDGDGQPDSWLEGCDNTCQSESGLILDDDNDNDGVANAQDAFPVDAAAAVDADNDGMPDAWLEGCDSACLSASELTLDPSLNDSDNDGFVNAEDAYPTDPSRAEDEDAPEMLKAPQAINVAATGESTLVTLNVNEAQAIDNFDNELDYQVELNGELLVINADQQVSLPSGALSLDWFAVDDAGIRSEPLAQAVNVYPQVRFTQSESTTGEDREASVAVELSGPSPAYPISILVSWVESDSDATIADVVNEGEKAVNLSELLVTIDSADVLENAAVRIPVVGDDLVESDEVLTLELAAAMAGSDVTFAMPIDGDRSSHRMTITDTNVAPTVSVIASQADETGTVFINDAGEITVTAEVTDVNGGDSHSYQWYTDALPVTPGDQASFTFDPVLMALGDYSISIVVTDDGNPMLSSEELTLEFTLQEAVVPDNGDVDSGDGDTGDGDTDDGSTGNGSETPVKTSTSSGGSSGGSVGLWLVCLLALGGLWRRRMVS